MTNQNTQTNTGQERVSVFISYAREDDRFALRLDESLRLKSIDVYGDWRLIRGAGYEEQLRQFILESDVFIFVISPNAAKSSACVYEIEIAVELKKRILPVVHQDCNEDSLHSALRSPQWTFLRKSDDFVEGVQGLIEAINTDFDLLPEHRRLLNAAETWQRNGRQKSYLLRKQGLQKAEDWLTQTSINPNKLPKPTSLQSEYILASRRDKTKGTRIAFGIVTAIALMMSLLTLVALSQRTIAKQNEQIAIENEKLAQSNEIKAKENEQLALSNEREAKQEKKNAEDNAKEALYQEGVAKENEKTAKENQLKAENALDRLEAKSQELREQVTETLKQKKRAEREADIANMRANLEKLKKEILELKIEAKNYTDLDEDRVVNKYKEVAALYLKLEEKDDYVTTLEETGLYIAGKRSNDIDYTDIGAGWLNEAIEKTDSSDRKAELYYQIARIYVDYGRDESEDYDKYKRIVENYQKAIEYFEKDKNFGRAAHITLQIGNLYTGLDKRADAVEFYKKAAKLYQEHPQANLIYSDVYTTDLQGTSLYLIAKTYSEMNNKNEAKRYFDLALPILEESFPGLETSYIHSQTAFMIGDIYAELGNKEKSDEFFGVAERSPYRILNEESRRRRNGETILLKNYCQSLLALEE